MPLKNVAETYPDPNETLVLMIDNAPRALQSTGDILKREGYRTTAATTGRQAESMADQLRPDLILLSTVLPDTNGFELCKRLKQSEVSREIPVILISEKRNTGDMLFGFRLGAVDFIVKPVDPDELLARMEVQLFIRRKWKEVARYQEQLEAEIEERENRIAELTRTVETLNDRNKVLKKQTITDDLTQLANRQYILERLSKEIAEARRYDNDLTIILFNIDHLKRINNTYGPPFGDNVVIHVASVIRKDLREMDIAGRYSSEEFLVVLPQTDIDGGGITAERIRANVEAQNWAEKKLNVTISGGVSTLRNEEDAARSMKTENILYKMLMKSGNLLYKAKTEGRNRIENDVTQT
jgi:diguanylate cyclase (GGDEF)-like protein